MALDPITLSSLVMANGVVFTVLWAVAAVRFPALTNIRYWIAAGVLTCVGGSGIMIGSELSGARIVLQVTVVAGYALYAMGVRVFHGAKPGFVPVAALLAVTTLALLALQGQTRLTEAFAMATPAIPLLATILFLLPRDRRSAGSGIAIAAMSVSAAGHLSLAGLMLTNSGAAGAAIMSYVLLALVYSGTIWNFGFAVMTIERFFTMVAVLARTDHLTGAANRRAFEDRLTAEVTRAAATNQTFCVLMIDLDHFKQLNDRYGHAWGDRSLVHLVQCVKSRTREPDLLARMGGDEFALLLPGTDIHLAQEMARQIAQTLAQSPVIWNGHRAGLKVSIGVAAWTSGMDAEKLICAADAALYAAKDAGRDTVKTAAHRASAADIIMRDETAV